MTADWQLVGYILSVLLIGWSLGIITYDIAIGDHKVLKDLIQVLRVAGAWLLRILRGTRK